MTGRPSRPVRRRRSTAPSSSSSGASVGRVGGDTITSPACVVGHEVRGHPPQLARADQAQQRLVAHDRQRGRLAAAEVLRRERVERELRATTSAGPCPSPSRRGHRRAGPPGRTPLERTRGAGQEPAGEQEHDAVADVAHRRQDEPDADQHEPERAADQSARAGSRAARCRRAPEAARRIRPPSSGNTGTRLTPASSRLSTASTSADSATTSRRHARPRAAAGRGPARRDRDDGEAEARNRSRGRDGGLVGRPLRLLPEARRPPKNSSVTTPPSSPRRRAAAPCATSCTSHREEEEECDRTGRRAPAQLRGPARSAAPRTGRRRRA